MRQVVIILFEGVTAYDVAGPSDAFALVRDDKDAPAYAVQFWSADGEVVTTASGLRLVGDVLPERAPLADLLIVPGGAGLREPQRLARVAGWLKANHRKFKRVASVCTGAFALAESGLLDGKQATTHWRFGRELATRYPRVQVKADALFLSDGKYHSSGGIAAGVDLALALIEIDHGARVATAAARELVVYLRRTGAQAQFSEPLKLQALASDRLYGVCAWAANNLRADLSVAALAKRASLSDRQFSRLFAASFGASPAHYVTRLRLDAARVALSQPRATIEHVARITGFQTPDGFRRAFEKRFQINPSEYQRRFVARSTTR
jgi:transcriptional regulator GlxA family with amidase domain